mmetsp:Transcript_50369/g.135100  ORF Transcript_50369/g.135100 Transcript_50369/m.135100 type:complete len:436 (-) Transcript_50369:7-1314(-)
MGGSSAAALPVMLLSTVLALAGATQDFPLLANVMFDICGVHDFQLTPSSPCHYNIFSFSVVWSECGEAHGTDFSGFRSCMDGCISKQTCKNACVSFQTKEDVGTCENECGRMVDCVREATMTAEGQVSAETDARTCFTGSGSGAASASFLATSRQGALVRALVSRTDPSGVSASALQPDADYHALFPENCALRLPGVGAPWAQPFPVPPSPMGLGTGTLGVPEPAPVQPRFANEVQAVASTRAKEAEPLPAEWHADRFEQFSGEKALPPDDGLAVPPALRSNHPWWRKPQSFWIEDCPKVVQVTGAESSVQGERMGIYMLTPMRPGLQQGGRPIYVSRDGHFLYYWKDMQSWRIGMNPRDATAGITSDATDAPCPGDAVDWRIFAGSSWVKGLPIKAVAAYQLEDPMPSPRALKGGGSSKLEGRAFRVAAAPARA